MMLYATLIGSYTVRLRLRLDSPIDKNAMRKAIDKTSARYPYLCVTLRKDNYKLYYEHNDKPVALINSLDKITLNSPETNDHIWAICYEDCGSFPAFGNNGSKRKYFRVDAPIILRTSFI